MPPKLIKDLVIDDHELAAYIEKLYQDVSIPMMVRIIEEGKNSGEISEDVSVENVLALIQLYMNQYQTILEMAERSEDMDRFLEGMVQLFFYGVCGKKQS
ncbi:hypothetical protein D3C81_2037320 [compost metagenome]